MGVGSGLYNTPGPYSMPAGALGGGVIISA
jgi:hypothetical protein